MVWRAVILSFRWIRTSPQFVSIDVAELIRFLFHFPGITAEIPRLKRELYRDKTQTATQTIGAADVIDFGGAQ